MSLLCHENDPFGIPSPIALVSRMLESLSGLSRCSRIYTEIGEQREGLDFFTTVLEHLGVTYGVADEEAARIPLCGPAVVVANHPFGGIEGLMLLDLLKRLRPDVKVIANAILCRIPELRDTVIPVNPFGSREAGRTNIAPMREGIRWVRGGGLLVIFPAGEVSHLNLRRREISDPKWNDNLARLVRKSEAPVVPVFFKGHNGPLFQLAGLLHPRLRTALLVRELLNKAGRHFPIRIGKAIPWKKLNAMARDDEMVGYLRLKTYLLGCSATAERSEPGSVPVGDEPVIPARQPEILAGEIGRLPQSQLLVDSGEMRVYQARAGQIPYALLEIGRLRELTFREVGEGTGKRYDLDVFDQHYTHIFIWNREKSEIVGAYRVGKTDEILRQMGKKGLYTHTLFRFRTRVFEQFGPALEMGRSFVRGEYQRSYAPLLLLWKGIGQFVAENPRYRKLFGPVSITRDYSDLSRQLIAGTLQETLSIPEMSRMIKPRMPMHVRRVRIKGCARASTRAVMSDMEELSSMIADIEIDRKGIPVLLRHYLNLGGKLLAFNLDPNFGDVLDGLILVDLMETDAKTLGRYMGKQGVAAFRAYHENLSAQSLADCA